MDCRQTALTFAGASMRQFTFLTGPLVEPLTLRAAE
jgi:hypothetical protein